MKHMQQTSASGPRYVRGSGDLPLDATAAIAVAKQAACDRGYAWIEPVSATGDGDVFVIATNAESLGGNLVVRVDRNSGEVLAIRSYSR